MTPSLFFNDPVSWAAPQNSFVFIYSVESNPICSTNFLFHNNPSYLFGKKYDSRSRSLSVSWHEELAPCLKRSGIAR